MGEKMENSVAIFSEVYLTISMTFIYRQLMHEGKYPKVVCSQKTENLKVFPYDSIICPESSPSFYKRLSSKMVKTFKKEFVVCHKDEDDFFINGLRKENTGLIHAHFGVGGIRMLPVKKALNIPLITTFHGYDLSSLLRDEGYVKQLNKLFKEGDIFISVSDYFKNRLIELGCSPEKIVTHYIGVPIEEYSFKKRELGKGTVRLIQVSNLQEKKGHIYLLEAFKKLISVYENVELVLVGDGPMKHEIEKKIMELGLTHKVKMMGKLKSLLALREMDESDIFVHHSVTASDGNTEGIPTVLMEAMSLGLPVVSTYHTGIPELVKDGETGLLTNEKDSDMMAKKLIELIGNPDLYKRLGTMGREKVERDFNIRLQNAKLDELYGQVMHII